MHSGIVGLPTYDNGGPIPRRAFLKKLSGLLSLGTNLGGGTGLVDFLTRMRAKEPTLKAGRDFAKEPTLAEIRAIIKESSEREFVKGLRENIREFEKMAGPLEIYPDELDSLLEEWAQDFSRRWGASGWPELEHQMAAVPLSKLDNPWPSDDMLGLGDRSVIKAVDKYSDLYPEHVDKLEGLGLWPEWDDAISEVVPPGHSIDMPYTDDYYEAQDLAIDKIREERIAEEAQATRARKGRQATSGVGGDPSWGKGRFPGAFQSPVSYRGGSEFPARIAEEAAEQLRRYGGRRGVMSLLGAGVASALTSHPLGALTDIMISPGHMGSGDLPEEGMTEKEKLELIKYYRDMNERMRGVPGMDVPMDFFGDVTHGRAGVPEQMMRRQGR